jgi:Acetyltransferase (GNAT) domain
MSIQNSSIVSPYVLRTCTDMLAWDAWVDASPQGHVFSKAAFIQCLGLTYTCYEVTTPQGEVLAGAVILEDGIGMAKAPFAFTPHQGIVFANSVAQQPSQKRLTVEFRITTFMIEALLDIYPNFSMALSPYFKDLRPFLWHNYGLEGMPKFEVKHRYTGHVNLQNFELTEFLKTVRSVRRQEYKKSQVQIQKADDLLLFLNLYQQTFERQGLAIDADTLGLVQRICEQALGKGYGYLSAAVVDDRTASMAFFVSDSRCSYYLFGANDPAMRETNASSKLLLDNIALSAQKGLQIFDFVGVNSPQRGDFKLSFNAELVPYQEVHLRPYA